MLWESCERVLQNVNISERDTCTTSPLSPHARPSRGGHFYLTRHGTLTYAPLRFGSWRWSPPRGEENDSQNLHREAGNSDNNPIRLIRARSGIEEEARAHSKQEATYCKAHKSAQSASFARSLRRPQVEKVGPGLKGIGRF